MQPEGPYALLGWCIAGTLAFEIARQLTAAGQTVSQLMLIDTYVPGYLKRMPWLKARLADYSHRWKLILADWRKTRGEPRRLMRFVANRVIVKKLARWILREPEPVDQDQPARGRPLSPEQYDQWLLHYLRHAEACYEPKPYQGSLTLLRSAQEPSGLFLDPKMGWSEFALGGVNVVVIDGDHFSIFREPGVQQMALHIRSTLSGKS